MTNQTQALGTVRELLKSVSENLRNPQMAGLARLVDRLCAKLAQHRRGARRVDVRRVDRGTAQVEIGLARPMRDPERVLSIVIDERIDVEIVV